MNEMIFFNFFLISIFNFIESVNIINVGILIPSNADSALHRDCGMYNSLGAIPLAIDRIVDEGLLDNYNFTFKIFNDECDESLAAGYVATLLEEDGVDVIFGPVCNAAAKVVGSIGNYYNKPIMTWGLANSYELTNYDKYPTVSTIVGTSRVLGRAIVKVMQQYNWKQFAFLYGTNDPRNRCGFIKTDVETVINNESDIFISYQRAISNTSLENLKTVLTAVSTRARIILCCYEFDIDKRNYLLALKDLKMNTDDYVNIFVEMRGLGFGTRFTDGAEYDIVSGTVPIWILGPGYPPDGRDQDAKNGARNSFFIDFQTSSSADSKSFASAVMERAQSWPFYCENCSSVYYNASTYAKYLHDSFYLYGLALNRTLASGNGTEGIPNGVDIILHTRGTFVGVTGVVNIGVNGTRDATFFFTGLRANLKSQVFMTIPFKEGVGTIYLNYTDSATTVWEIRGGKVPLDVPLCGFAGNLCPVDFWANYYPYVIAAIVVAL
ncbi:hypothetical protein FO519_002949, partial [Halicephalobus sp. NKZ332]